MAGDGWSTAGRRPDPQQWAGVPRRRAVPGDLPAVARSRRLDTEPHPPEPLRAVAAQWQHLVQAPLPCQTALATRSPWHRPTRGDPPSTTITSAVRIAGLTLTDDRRWHPRRRRRPRVYASARLRRDVHRRTPQASPAPSPAADGPPAGRRLPAAAIDLPGRSAPPAGPFQERLRRAAPAVWRRLVHDLALVSGAAACFDSPPRTAPPTGPASSLGRPAPGTRFERLVLAARRNILGNGAAATSSSPGSSSRASASSPTPPPVATWISRPPIDAARTSPPIELRPRGPDHPPPVCRDRQSPATTECTLLFAHCCRRIGCRFLGAAERLPPRSPWPAPSHDLQRAASLLGRGQASSANPGGGRRHRTPRSAPDGTAPRGLWDADPPRSAPPGSPSMMYRREKEAPSRVTRVPLQHHPAAPWPMTPPISHARSTSQPAIPAEPSIYSPA